MTWISEILKDPAATAIIAFLSGFIGQWLLSKQKNNHEIKKFRLENKKNDLIKLRDLSERLISQIYTYDELADHIDVTLKNGAHDNDRLDLISKKIKKLKEEISPKIQIYFHEMTSTQNSYSNAIAKFNNSFFAGLKYEGIKQIGWNKENLEKLQEEYLQIQIQKEKLIKRIINYLQEKEKEISE